jgi:alkanesulfonate monooxygenase SsuD/methylene tetrahydromethanopterin reductase-like flavin-dependent oxidoreductase (luciferase family)
VIKPWVFEFFPAPREDGMISDPQRSLDYFNQYLELWPRGEPLGYEGIFFSEHHFGVAYSPAPNLLIAQVALKTRTLRLGVMGMVLPYHQPWKIVEEIGMLDHLTRGRLEIGTAAGIPQEMAQVGLSVAEARERNDEAIEILDAALAQPVISHYGKYWRFNGLRLVPRPLQQPAPPRWVTVVSEESARKAARRGAKICTGFHPNDRVKRIFDAYRDEAERVGNPSGPEQMALRRQVTIGVEDRSARAASRVRERDFRAYIQHDPRVSAPGREVF